ncbi:hypothetical protein DXG01_016404 [Tephrocybe rancida]|nr:hypothetical protein DXG01_016404 [Tephrocybe rancida]
MVPVFYKTQVAFVGFTFVRLVLAPWASKRWFAATYGPMGKRARGAWSIHIVSQIHALLIVPLALWVISHQQKAANQGPTNARARAFEWDGRVLIGGVEPFVAYYGTRCLLWESSTFFLKIPWPMDKTGRIGARATSGCWARVRRDGVRSLNLESLLQPYQFLHTLMQVRHEMSWTYLAVYGTDNALLKYEFELVLFYKMISALRRRFTDEQDPERRRFVDGNGNGHDNADNKRTVTNEDSAEGAYRTQN